MNQPSPGLVIAGRYRLERSLASGGMGSVWIARHVELDADVAIKFIASAASSEARARFQREAKAAARIKSPHVVHVQDYGVDKDLPYIVMELLHGEDLATRLKRQQRLSLEQALAILVQVARALRRTHDEGIVHRDLKPGNIFLVRVEDDEDLVKIVDFGIAKGTGPFIGDDSTKTGDVMGSPSYMSPEQIRGVKDIDVRSDLWSLGVILFRAVTGRLPFVSEMHIDIFVKIVTDAAPPPSALAPDLPPELDAFFEKALAKDRRARFQSPREMVEAFARIARPSMLPALAAGSLFGQVAPSAPADRRDSSRPPLQGGAPHIEVVPPAPPTAKSAPAAPAPASSESTITGPTATTTDTPAPSPRRLTRWRSMGAGATGLLVAGGLLLVMRVRQAPPDTSTAEASAPPTQATESASEKPAPPAAETSEPAQPPPSETAVPMGQKVQAHGAPPRVGPAPPAASLPTSTALAGAPSASPAPNHPLSDTAARDRQVEAPTPGATAASPSEQPASTSVTTPTMTSAPAAQPAPQQEQDVEKYGF